MVKASESWLPSMLAILGQERGTGSRSVGTEFKAGQHHGHLPTVSLAVILRSETSRLRTKSLIQATIRLLSRGTKGLLHPIFVKRPERPVSHQRWTPGTLW